MEPGVHRLHDPRLRRVASPRTCVVMATGSPPPTPPARVATSPARDSAPRLSPRHHTAPRVAPAASRDPAPPPRAQPHPGPGGPRSLPRSLSAEPTLRPRGQAPPPHAHYPGPQAADWASSSAPIDRGPPRALFSGSSSRLALAQAPVTSDWCSFGSLSPDWLSRTACGPPGFSRSPSHKRPRRAAKPPA